MEHEKIEIYTLDEKALKDIVVNYLQSKGINAIANKIEFDCLVDCMDETNKTNFVAHATVNTKGVVDLSE